MVQVVIILVMLMGAGGFGAYSWVTKLQAENKILQVNQEKLEGAVAENEAALRQQAAEAAKIQVANSELRDAQVKLQADSKNLAKKLGKHELDILAQNKPALVLRLINRASGAELRCFELTTGAEHTPEELAATKKSQSNRECPGLANPNLGKENTE
jgi:type IV secretory pathway TrbL component